MRFTDTLTDAELHETVIQALCDEHDARASRNATNAAKLLRGRRPHVRIAAAFGAVLMSTSGFFQGIS